MPTLLTKLNHDSSPILPTSHASSVAYYSSPHHRCGSTDSGGFAPPYSQHLTRFPSPTIHTHITDVGLPIRTIIHPPILPTSHASSVAYYILPRTVLRTLLHYPQLPTPHASLHERTSPRQRRQVRRLSRDRCQPLANLVYSRKAA